MVPFGPACLESPQWMDQWHSSFCQANIWPCPWLGSCCRLASVWLCIPGAALPCPALSSWNQSAHLLKKPLHQRSPRSCWSPRAAGFRLYRIFEISDLCVWAVPPRGTALLWSTADFTRVWRGQESPESPLFQTPALKEALFGNFLEKKSEKIMSFCMY